MSHMSKNENRKFTWATTTNKNRVTKRKRALTIPNCILLVKMTGKRRKKDGKILEEKLPKVKRSHESEGKANQAASMKGGRQQNGKTPIAVYISWYWFVNCCYHKNECNPVYQRVPSWPPSLQELLTHPIPSFHHRGLAGCFLVESNGTELERMRGRWRKILAEVVLWVKVYHENLLNEKYFKLSVKFMIAGLELATCWFLLVCPSKSFQDGCH